MELIHRSHLPFANCQDELDSGTEMVPGGETTRVAQMWQIKISSNTTWIIFTLKIILLEIQI